MQGPKCPCPDLGENMEFASPCSGEVTRGTAVHMKCKQGTVLASGELSLACGEEGTLLGSLPVCAGM